MSLKVLLSTVAIMMLTLTVGCHDEIPTSVTSTPVQEPTDSLQTAAVTQQTSDSADSCGQIDFYVGKHFSFGVSRHSGQQVTYVSSQVTSSGAHQCQVQLQLFCHRHIPQAAVTISNLAWSNERPAVLALQIDDQPDETLEVRLDPVYGTDREILAGAAQLEHSWYDRLKSGERLTIELSSDVGNATFDLVEMFNTPVQEILDKCGESNVSAPHR